MGEMKDITIIQCGHDKSGTYLLYRLLSGILRQNNLYCSFMASSGLGFIIDRCFPENKRYDEVNEVDYIRKGNGGWGVNFPSPDCRHVPVDLDLILQYSSFCYTHESPATIDALRDKFSHRIYLMRDGRDVVNSYIHFLTNDISLNLCPEYKISNPLHLYDNLSYFEKLVRDWHEHILSYDEYKEDYCMLKFEDLLEDREKVIKTLSCYLDLPVNATELAGSTTFKAMKKKAPLHLRRGLQGDWSTYFTDKHKEIFKSVAGDSLIQQGYEKSNQW